MKKLRWLYPGMTVKRWIVLIMFGVILCATGMAFLMGLNLIEDAYNFIRHTLGVRQGLAGDVCLLLGILSIYFGISGLARSLLSVFLGEEDKERLVDLMFQKRYLDRGFNVVVIGGGTGLNSLLRGIKQFTSNISAVVTVTDEGGSSGILREEFGMLPPGDIRNCIAALADEEQLMTDLLQYRFEVGEGLKGHPLGNLLIAAMTEIEGDFEAAVNKVSRILAIRGRVIPSTLEKVRLMGEMEDGTIIAGETTIAESDRQIARAFLEPNNPRGTAAAVDAILQADAIVMGPGSLYTSIIPNFLVPDINQAVRDSKAVKIFVCNIMTQPGETDNLSASEHLKVVLDRLGPGSIHCMIINDAIPSRLVQKYLASGSSSVRIDLEEVTKHSVEPVLGNFIWEQEVIRHDPEKLAEKILEILLSRPELRESVTKRMSELEAIRMSISRGLGFSEETHHGKTPAQPASR